MAETPRGIVYPESGAHTRLWEHFQALADTADDAITAGVAEATLVDSGWVGIPFASGWRNNATGAPLSIRKIGKVCYLRGTVTNTAGSIPTPPASGYTIATLPGGFLPSADTASMGIPQNLTNTQSRVFANANGTLVLFTYTSSTPYVSINCVYPVA